LLGRVGSIEKSDIILQQTIEKIKNGSVEPNRIIKSVLVIDEAQDMNEHEFGLVKILMEKNEGMRVVAVGDDDQNIYTFRGADSKYFEQFIKVKNAIKYELIENYRSQKNLVDFTNKYVSQIQYRLKETPIISVHKGNGNIRIVNYQNENFIVPFVNEVITTALSGTSAVLTKTNDEALKITGLLLKKGFPAKLIQTNDGFKLSDMLEIRSFINDIKADNTTPTISLEAWNYAKREFAKKHKKSINYDICKQLLIDFQEINPKVKYSSDFQVFIKESKIEDFITQKGDIIIVSTIHKAKGKEFDNVFIMLDGFTSNTDDSKRQLYVAMTRAKQNLTIHYNGNFINNIETDNLIHITNNNTHDLPQHLVYHLSHRDINLGYFAFIQNRISSLSSGDPLSIGDKGLTNANNEIIVKFSKSFQSYIDSLQKQGYKLIESKVRFILYWRSNSKDTSEENEILIVLPELYFEICNDNKIKQEVV